MHHSELMLKTTGAASDLCLAARCAGAPGILAVARQGFEGAPHHSSSVLSAGFGQRALLCFCMGFAHRKADTFSSATAVS